MLAGVTIVDSETTWIEPTVEIEPDVTIHPFAVLRGATRIETGAQIHPNTVAVDSHVGAGAIVGPFCYLRPGTVLGVDAKAGTFVEIKNSTIGDRTKVPHLSYLGDADVGATRTWAPARSPRTSDTGPDSQKAAPRSAATSGLPSTMGSSHL